MDKIKLGKKVLNELEHHGYKAYFVGGFIRDLLLNREINDIDIATDAHPEKVMSIFSKTIPTGKKHGTITVLMEGIPFEVTTFRSEGKYLDYRHPTEVKFVSNIEEDLSRRDFTINAIAMSKNEDIIDPFNGKKALEDGMIVAVGNPEKRFLEDPLRMMRAIRFASQLNFKIEEQTYRAIVAKAPYLRYIATERIKIELDKIMVSKFPEIGIKLLYETTLINWVKGFEHTSITRINYEEVCKFIKLTEDPLIRWFLLLIQIDQKDHSLIMSHLRFSNKERDNVKKIFQAHSILEAGLEEVNFKKCLVETGESYCLKLVKIFFLLGHITESEKNKLIKKVMRINGDLPAKEIEDLAISGRDLINHFNQPGGPWIKVILNRLLEMVIYDNLANETNILLQQAKLILEEKKDEGKN
ncbi:CCA tRNA nucleotidyltransferase [Vulcanibacillus modesticaldus]|nr:CCA tRNA nucleotidyltransferase [Vulcanibacillus modesticaldus]